MNFPLFEMSIREQLLKDQQLVSCAKLLERIGNGSAGRVYKALATCGIVIAVKIVPFCYSISLKVLNSSKFEELESKAMNEGNIQAKLNHRNITKIFNVYTSQNCIILHMEYFDGQDLWPFLKERDFSLDKKHATKIVNQLDTAIEYLHTMDVVHGDLHMGNVLVNDNHVVKLIDFGSAIITENSKVKVTDLIELRGVQDMINLSTENPEKVKEWFLKEWF